jgi:hypothetical protein
LEMVVRETLSSAANEARVALRLGVGLLDMSVTLAHPIRSGGPSALQLLQTIFISVRRDGRTS